MRLNEPSIARGNPQLGFELMNGEKRQPAPERSRCGHLIAVLLTLSHPARDAAASRESWLESGLSLG
jgi:hypothetical protein